MNDSSRILSILMIANHSGIQHPVYENYKIFDNRYQSSQ